MQWWASDSIWALVAFTCFVSDVSVQSAPIVNDDPEAGGPQNRSLAVNQVINWARRATVQ